MIQLIIGMRARTPTYLRVLRIYQISVLNLEINVIVIDSILIYGMYNQKQIIQTNHAKTTNPETTFLTKSA